jgi:single-stranded-DNA-specific exonuclease
MIAGPVAARWSLHSGWSRDRARWLSSLLGAPVPMAQVLINRGLGDEDAARRFLDPDWGHLHRHDGLRGMESAVARIRAAIVDGEPILVHGDYDVDGVTSTFLMVSVVRRLGGRVEHRIPHRTKDGYGLSGTAIDEAAARGIRLVITVDSGITAFEPIARARALGIDVIVTDHHEPGRELPADCTVINPRQPECAYPFKSLAGVGVAFKLAHALLDSFGQADVAQEYLDVVALGTIADAVPLAGENRVLAWLGLERLSRTERPGLRALIEICGLAGRRITGGQVAFQLAPRMNAAGRMGSAQPALDLLFARDADEGRACAESLEDDNNRRREQDERVEREASEQVESVLGWPDCGGIVLWNEAWHPGVLGIVASRLVERYCRPSLLLSMHGPWARGSGRSVSGIDLVRILSECEDLLEGYGGHAHAAGLTVARERLPELRERFDALVRRTLDPLSYAPALTLDDELELGSCDLELVQWIERLPPFGLGNGEPTFRAAEVAVDSVSRVGGGRHLKFRARDASGGAEAIAFGGGELAGELANAGRCAIAYVPQRNEWMGEPRIQLKVKALRME